MGSRQNQSGNHATGNSVQIEMGPLTDKNDRGGRWKALFYKYAEDGEDRIQTRLFAEKIRKDPSNRHVPKHVVRKIVAEADKNHDGYITYTEFIDMIRTPDGYQLLNGWINKYISYTIPRRHRLGDVRTQSSEDETDGQYEEEYSCWPPPICMFIISVLEIASFVYDYTVTNKVDAVDGPSANIFIYNPNKKIEVWRFFTYMFVHVGFHHIAVNLFVQIALGIPLEMVHKWWRILLIYLAGVAAGSLLTSVISPTTFIAGASSGVYALITAHLATLILNWSEMQCALIQLIIFCILCATDIGSNLYTYFVLNNDTKIGHAAHAGGAIAGLLVGLYVLRNLEVHSWEKKVCLAALCLYLILTAAAIVNIIIMGNN